MEAIIFMIRNMALKQPKRGPRYPVNPMLVMKAMVVMAAADVIGGRQATAAGARNAGGAR